MTYFAPVEAVTPSKRRMTMSKVCSSSGGGACGALISTASDFSTRSVAFMPLASSVAPVETRSQMAAAIFMRGATSTAPRISTISAVMLCDFSQARQDVGIGGGDALADKPLRAGVIDIVGHGDLERAAAETQPHHDHRFQINAV